MNPNEIPSWMRELAKSGIPVSLNSDNPNPLIITPSRKERLSKSKYITNYLHEHSNEFLSSSNLSCLVGTWNVMGREISNDLCAWLGGCTPNAPDIVFVGLQEIDERTESYFIQNKEIIQKWSMIILYTLQRSYSIKYEVLKSESLVGIFGCLLIRSDLQTRFSISPVTVKYLSCGRMMGILGNKGAVAFRIKIEAQHLMFVNCHLAAHVEGFRERNENFRFLSSRFRFDKPLITSQNPTCDHIKMSWSVDDATNVWDCSGLVWLGDLNYRIDGSDVPGGVSQWNSEEIKRLALAGKYYSLLERDQLIIAMSGNKSIFGELIEAPITFPPTYKYDLGTNNFDTSEKQRAPAWTDRILFSKTINCSSYNSCQEMMQSDHRPVWSQMTIETLCFIDQKLLLALEKVRQNLDDLENDAMSVVKVSELNIKLPRLLYGVEESKEIRLENTGECLAFFYFDAPAFWIRVSPDKGFINTGEIFTITISATIQGSTIASINEQEKTVLDEILILHVKNGVDFFISVNSVWKKSVFADSIEEQYMQMIEHSDYLPSIYENTDIPYIEFNGIPAPLSRLVKYLMVHIDDFEFLLINQELNTNLQKNFLISLDDNIPFPSYKGYGFTLTAFECLLQYLDSLIEPVIPYSHYEAILKSANDRDTSFIILRSIPSSHQAIFEYIRHFIQLIFHKKHFSHENMHSFSKYTAKKSHLFSSNIFQSNDKGYFR